MSAQIALYLKLGLVGLLMVGVFTLAILGRLDAAQAVTAATGGVGALVVALGIQGGACTIAKSGPGSSAVLAMLGAGLLLGACASSGAASSSTPSTSDVGAYEQDLLACIGQSDTRAAADACRAAVDAKWQAKFPDGGVNFVTATAADAGKE